MFNSNKFYNKYKSYSNKVTNFRNTDEQIIDFINESYKNIEYEDKDAINKINEFKKNIKKPLK